MEIGEINVMLFSFSFEHKRYTAKTFCEKYSTHRLFISDLDFLNLII